MQQTINTFSTARKGRGDTVVIEGMHALKHALRFDADITELFTVERSAASSLAREMADENTALYIIENATEISEEHFQQIAPHAGRTGVAALAMKKQSAVGGIKNSEGHIVVLENPKDLDNIGAVVRVCAARGIAGLIITGESTPWHANAIRGGAGLQWALNIAEMDIESALEDFSDRAVFACTDEGEDMYELDVPDNAILIFGTEREGITESVRDAHKKLAIPMQPGVSSMNLATSVSAVLFSVKP